MVLVPAIHQPQRQKESSNALQDRPPIVSLPPSRFHDQLRVRSAESVYLRHLTSYSFCTKPAQSLFGHASRLVLYLLLLSPQRHENTIPFLSSLSPLPHRLQWMMPASLEA